MFHFHSGGKRERERHVAEALFFVYSVPRPLAPPAPTPVEAALSLVAPVLVVAVVVHVLQIFHTLLQERVLLIAFQEFASHLFTKKEKT